MVAFVASIAAHIDSIGVDDFVVLRDEHGGTVEQETRLVIVVHGNAHILHRYRIVICITRHRDV